MEERLDKFLRGLKQEVRVAVEMREPGASQNAISLAEKYDRIMYHSARYKTAAELMCRDHLRLPGELYTHSLGSIRRLLLLSRTTKK